MRQRCKRQIYIFKVPFVYIDDQPSNRKSHQTASSAATAEQMAAWLWLSERHRYQSSVIAGHGDSSRWIHGYGCRNDTDTQTHTWQWREAPMLCSVFRACGIETCEVVEWGYGLNYIRRTKGTFIFYFCINNSNNNNNS